MDRNQLALLKEIMEVEFVLVETTLYLNTHPTDERALRLHNTFAHKLSELEDMYLSQYGMLRATQMSRFPWQNIESPWPWEIDYRGF